MKPTAWQNYPSSRGARLRLVMLWVLCGLVGWAGVQPNGADSAGNAEIVAHWEQFSQGIPSERQQIRFGLRALNPDQGGAAKTHHQPCDDNPLDQPWLVCHSIDSRAGLVLATTGSFAQPLLRQTSVHSPYAPRAPPLA